MLQKSAGTDACISKARMPISTLQPQVSSGIKSFGQGVSLGNSHDVNVRVNEDGSGTIGNHISFDAKGKVSVDGQEVGDMPITAMGDGTFRLGPMGTTEVTSAGEVHGAMPSVTGGVGTISLDGGKVHVGEVTVDPATGTSELGGTTVASTDVTIDTRSGMNPMTGASQVEGAGYDIGSRHAEHGGMFGIGWDWSQASSGKLGRVSKLVEGASGIAAGTDKPTIASGISSGTDKPSSVIGIGSGIGHVPTLADESGISSGIDKDPAAMSV